MLPYHVGKRYRSNGSRRQALPEKDHVTVKAIRRYLGTRDGLVGRDVVVLCVYREGLLLPNDRAAVALRPTDICEVAPVMSSGRVAWITFNVAPFELGVEHGLWSPEDAGWPWS